MAEFKEVLHHFQRLCDAAKQNCDKCGMQGMSCSITDFVNNPDEVEYRIMKWAEENPE